MPLKYPDIKSVWVPEFKFIGANNAQTAIPIDMQICRIYTEYLAHPSNTTSYLAYHRQRAVRKFVA